MIELKERLERFTKRSHGCECWIFTGSDIGNTGYGRLRINGKRILVHRLSYSLYVGDPGSLHVLHKCDVPLCINPDHLFAGTQADNMRDKSNKNRCADRHNENHPLCRLSDEQIAHIRNLRSDGWKQDDLAKAFSVTQSHISRILSWHSRKTMRSVPTN